MFLAMDRFRAKIRFRSSATALREARRLMPASQLRTPPRTTSAAKLSNSAAQSDEWVHYDALRVSI